MLIIIIIITSFAPISSKIKLSVATRPKPVIIRQCVSRQWMDEEARRLRKIGSIKEICFRRRRNETILPSDLTLAGREFHTVGAATEKARVPAFVFTRGM